MASGLKLALAAAALALPALPAAAVTINFDNLAVGTTLSNQYAGVTFVANAFSGAGSSSSGTAWATNTDMTIVSSTGTDVGTLGTPSLVSGNILRSFNGWVNENGDANFSMNFAAAINSISVTFAGVFTPADTRLFIYNGSTLLTTVAGTGTAGVTSQFALSYAAPSITRVVVAPGSFNDWVGVDNIVYQPAAAGAVPEPAGWAMMIAGFGLVGFTMRRRQSVRVSYRLA